MKKDLLRRLRSAMELEEELAITSQLEGIFLKEHPEVLKDMFYSEFDAWLEKEMESIDQ
jgi:hypothetical protein